jgi:hypothetical protein
MGTVGHLCLYVAQHFFSLIQPRHAHARIERIYLPGHFLQLERRGEYSSAVIFYEKALKMDPGNTDLGAYS